MPRLSIAQCLITDLSLKLMHLAYYREHHFSDLSHTNSDGKEERDGKRRFLDVIWQ